MDPSYNSFGSFDLNGGQPIASDNSVPMPVNDTKKKKWWIVGIVVAAVAIVGVVGFLLSQKMTAKTTMQKFNVYANYLLDGSDSSKNVEEGAWAPYCLISRVAEAEGNYEETYFDNLAKKFEAFAADFSNKYKAEDFEDEDEYEWVSDRISGIKTSLDALKVYAVKTTLTEEELQDLSAEEVKEYYSDFLDSDNYYLQSFANASMGFAQATKDKNTEAEKYFYNEIDRIERRLVLGVVENSEWVYDTIGKIGDKE